MRTPGLLRRAAVVVVVAMLLLVGAAAPAVLAAPTRVAIVFATGGLGDKSFNDSAMDGMQKARQQLGVDFQYAEPSAIAEYETYLTQFAQTRRYDLIISIGFDQADALTAVASRFPQQKFAIVDMVVDRPNVASYVYREPERGFALGAVAAAMTTRRGDPRINPDRVVGIVGGMKIPIIDANIAGFMAGAGLVDPQVRVLYSYVGSWADPAKGKELALAMFDQGADIVWGAAGRSGLGVIKAAEERGRYSMGADSEQDYLAPGSVLTNGMKYVNQTVLTAIRAVMEGRFRGGVHVLGIAEGALGYSKSLVPDDVAARVDPLIARVVRGELVPPERIEDVEAWLARHR